MRTKQANKELYTIAELARLLGISKQALHRRVKANKLPANVVKHVQPDGTILLKYTPTL